MIVGVNLFLGCVELILILTPHACKRDTFLLPSFSSSGCTTSCFRHGNRDGLNMDVRGGFVAMHVEADDILLTPAFTSPGVCVLGPVLNALSQTDIGIARLEREINFLVTKGKTR